MKRNLIIIFILSIFIIIPGCGNAEKEANDHFTKARDYRQKGDFNKALDEYRTIIYVYPKSLLVSKAQKMTQQCEDELRIKSTFDLAEQLINEKFFEAALFVLRNVIDANPDTFYTEDIRKKINLLTDNRAENVMTTAVNYQDKGRYNEAIELYKKFLNDFPYNKEIEQVKVNILKCEEAIALLKVQAERDKEKERKKAEEERKNNEERQRIEEKERLEKEKLKKEMEKKSKINNAIKALMEKAK
ncbi:tetratricopeptide repeat protein [Candidatus Poribacteria bacterium]|nr:tetratricopeptide repeat protein [Candidatus Poribacteria bacterium]